MSRKGIFFHQQPNPIAVPHVLYHGCLCIKDPLTASIIHGLLEKISLQPPASTTSFPCSHSFTSLAASKGAIWLRNALSTAGNSVSSSKRPSLEPLLKRRCPQPYWGGENSRNGTQGKKKHSNINKCAGIVPGMGGCRKFVYVLFFQVIPYRGEKHINKIHPPQIPG